MAEIKVNDVAAILERFSPLALQEDYDNSGLQVGDKMMVVSGILLTIDVTLEVLQEAETNNCNLIISHHPITLSGIKNITADNTTGRLITRAIQKNIAIYTAHTNIDSVLNGVSGMFAKKLGLINCEVLDQRSNQLTKIATFVPVNDATKVRNALFQAGAGHIGNYDLCSYNTNGYGTFRGDETTNPYIGDKGKLHTEDEVRIETIFPTYLQASIVNALIAAHPYEEPAYDLYPLKNEWKQAGYGIIGTLQNPLAINDFLKILKSLTKTGCIRYTETNNQQVQKIAICGGSGSYLIKKAIKAGADVFVTGDIKYHQFFETTNMVIADIGHYESEQFTKELFFELLTKNLPNFAVRLSNINTNPIKYY
jgi:dinuclear metal center YbgI/SA1388 family protein